MTQLSTERKEVTIKLVLIGDSNTGKTSLLHRFIDNKFAQDTNSTVGIDFRMKVINFESIAVKVQIFDTAGQERFHTITQAYYRNADGALLVFDVTNDSSFAHLRHWIAEITPFTASTIKLVVGNKCDCEESRTVTNQQAEKLAQEEKFMYMETSAKSGTNVEETFMYTIHAILQQKGIFTSRVGEDVITPDGSNSTPDGANGSGPITLAQPNETATKKEGCC